MRHLLLLLIVLSGGTLDAEAAYKARRVVFHTMDYEYGAETELLDCKYGEANIGLGPGKCFSGGGDMPLPDFLYVKWRDRTTGTVYEERIDLKRRLPSPRKMYRNQIYWLIEDNQLYVYLIPFGGDQYNPRNLRPPDKPRNGPIQDSFLDVKTLYPDNAPPRVHGWTPQWEATDEKRRAERAARKAAQDAARREAAERGECLIVEEIAGICKPAKPRMRLQP